MTLKLNLWQASNGFARIYLNGLPVEGKAWLQASRGRTVVQFEKGSPGMPPDAVLALVAETAGCDPTFWRGSRGRGRDNAEAGKGRMAGPQCREPSWHGDRIRSSGMDTCRCGPARPE